CWGAVGLDAGSPGVPVTLSVPRPMGTLGVPESKYLCGVAVDQSIWCWNLAGGSTPVQIQ
ncbi:MAG: hypothetical protein ACHQ0I_05665, partial [Candidatus Lutacidiplasmatales archaeon]